LVFKGVLAITATFLQYDISSDKVRWVEVTGQAKVLLAIHFSRREAVVIPLQSAYLQVI
jgi:hypothetical protein